MMRLGEQIKVYRKNAGLTQEQIANVLGVSTPAVNKWEIGNHHQAEEIAEITEHMVSLFGLWDYAKDMNT